MVTPGSRQKGGGGDCSRGGVHSLCGSQALQRAEGSTLETSQGLPVLAT